ncbi:MAG: hypothetical protein HY291_18145 [Planctomycetes bacterium]|nr:hypothetical protein [Planctomycetota bacterium]
MSSEPAHAPPSNPPPAASVDLAALSKAEVRDSEGDKSELGKLWTNQKAVLIFLSALHEAALAAAARARTSQAAAHLKGLRLRGAEVYLIVPSESVYLEPFEEELRPGCVMYADPERRAFRAAGMRRVSETGEQAKGLLGGLRSLLGTNGTQIMKDAELGGVVALLPPGRVAFARAAADLSAPLPLSEVEEALKSAGWSHLAVKTEEPE